MKAKSKIRQFTRSYFLIRSRSQLTFLFSQFQSQWINILGCRIILSLSFWMLVWISQITSKNWKGNNTLVLTQSGDQFSIYGNKRRCHLSCKLLVSNMLLLLISKVLTPNLNNTKNSTKFYVMFLVMAEA